jgi:hypothetical protein
MVTVLVGLLGGFTTFLRMTPTSYLINDGEVVSRLVKRCGPYILWPGTSSGLGFIALQGSVTTTRTEKVANSEFQIKPVKKVGWILEMRRRPDK